MFSDNTNDLLKWTHEPTKTDGTFPGFRVSPDPCEMCINNPKNNKFASGICMCTLGTPVIY